MTQARRPLPIDAPYRAGQPEGYGYRCDLYAAWRGRLSPTMRQTHLAGEKLFVPGQTVEVIDGSTGEVRRAQIFVAALGAPMRMDTGAAGLDRLPCRCLHELRRRHAADRLRQSQGRHRRLSL